MISAFTIAQQNNPFESSIQQILGLDRQKKDALAQELSTFNSQKQALTTIGTSFSSLQKVLTGFMENPQGAFRALKSNSTSDSVRVVSSTGTANQSFSVKVNRLASQDLVNSARLQKTGTELSATGSASLSIQVGDAEPVSISLDTAGKTNEEVFLELRDRVNELTGGAATADFLNVNSQEGAFKIKSSVSGESGKIQITDIQGDFAALSLSNSLPSNELNASFEIDGIEFERSSNLIEDAVSGLTLELTGVTESAVQLNFSQDVEASVKAVESFVDAFNNLNKTIRDRTFLNNESDTRGILQRERAIRNVSINLRQTMLLPADSLAGESISRLTDIGISIGADGALSISNRDMLEQILVEQPEIVEALFTGNGGIVEKINTNIGQALSGDGNILKAIESGIEGKIERTNSRITREDRFLENREAQLRKEFSLLQEIIDRGTAQFNQVIGFQNILNSFIQAR